MVIVSNIILEYYCNIFYTHITIHICIMEALLNLMHSIYIKIHKKWPAVHRIDMQ